MSSGSYALLFIFILIISSEKKKKENWLSIIQNYIWKPCFSSNQKKIIMNNLYGTFYWLYPAKFSPNVTNAENLKVSKQLTDNTSKVSSMANTRQRSKKKLDISVIWMLTITFWGHLCKLLIDPTSLSTRGMTFMITWTNSDA